MQNYSTNLDQPICFQLQTLETISSVPIQSLIIALYSCTALFSLVGNIVVVLVQVLGRESSGSNTRKYVINLAVSDIVHGVLCVPFSYSNFVLRQWPFPHWLCPTAQGVQLLSVFVTSGCLTLIGIERYITSLHSLSRTTKWLQSHTTILLTLTWILGSIYSFVPSYYTKTNQFNYDGEIYYQCSYYCDWTLQQRHLFMMLNFVLTFVIPSAILTFAYLEIMRKLKLSKMKNYWTVLDITYNLTTVTLDKNNNCSLSSKTTRLSKYQSRSTRFREASKQINNLSKSIQTMFVIICLYDICWFPIKLYQFLLDYDIITFCSEFQFYSFIYTYIACHWLAMANSCANPIVYSFMSKTFRNDLRRISSSICSVKRSFEPNTVLPHVHR